MHALVTGAGGFVGRHLVARLRADGWTVTALTRERVDLTDPATLERLTAFVHDVAQGTWRSGV